MTWAHRVLFLLFAFVLGGCATVSAKAHPVTFTAWGDADRVHQAQKEVLDRFQKLREQPPAEKISQVKVLQDTVPEGIEIKEGVISVKEGSPYVVLGKFKLTPGSASTVWFADYDPTWRKWLCYPQVPLTWVTLGLWQIFVPLSYPCAGGGLKRDTALEQVRTLAVVAGANLVVISMKNKDEDVYEVVGLLIHTDLERLANPPDSGGKKPPPPPRPSVQKI